MIDSIDCAICGADLGKSYVNAGLVQWRKPHPGRTWEVVPRCEDRTACAERVKAKGEKWPLVSATTEIPGLRDRGTPTTDHRAEYRRWAANAPAGSIDRSTPKVNARGEATFAKPKPMYQGDEPKPVETGRPAPDDPTTWW